MLPELPVSERCFKNVHDAFKGEIFQSLRLGTIQKKRMGDEVQKEKWEDGGREGKARGWKTMWTQYMQGGLT